MGRAACCEKVGMRKGRWTEEEDSILKAYILAHGEGSWRSLPKNAGLLRCGKSCRLRWINYLRLDLKRGNITPQEEETIVKLHSTLGNRWSVIASGLPGRTDNEVKNYWNSHLRRKLHCFRKIINIKSIGTVKAGGGKEEGNSRSKCSNNEVEDEDVGLQVVETTQDGATVSVSVDHLNNSSRLAGGQSRDDRVWMSSASAGEQELLSSWLMWDSDATTSHPPTATNDDHQAMLAWLLS